ncbi:MAG: S41 family peptidase [Acidobacteriota bacterium]|nr:S41 family peptidase [Acidobacteriota bacterium]
MFSKTKISIILLSSLFVAYGLVGGLLERVSAGDDAYKGLRVFTDVLNKVRENYVEQPDLERAMRGGLHGMMEALDPYSSLVDGEVYRRMEEAKADKTADPGIVLSRRYGYAYVVSTVPGSAAHAGGVQTGDLLETIDGQMTAEMSLWEARKLLVGDKGSSVSLRVIRARRSIPAPMELVREEMELPEVSARMVEDGIGALTIPHFQEGVTKDVSAKLKMLLSSGLEGLIVDVRGTATGILEEAVQVSDLFLPLDAMIVSVGGRSGDRSDFLSTTEPLLSDIRIVLLIDGGTSGAAEVFAGALKDHAIGETVGERTDGQGSVQTLFTLEDGSILEILTQLYYRSSGKPVQGRKQKDSGIAPEVQSPSPDLVTSFYFENAGDDPEATLGGDFYQELNQAIREAQFEEGLNQIRGQLLMEAA